MIEFPVIHCLTLRFILGLNLKLRHKAELGPTLQSILPFSSKDKDHPVKLSQM